MSRRVSLVLVLLAVLLCPASARSAQDDLTRAEAAFALGKEEYQKGRYSKAIEHFQSIIDRGLASPQVYYNLGGAYYKAGRPGKAIVNFLRALRLNPRDGDARYNLSFVISTLKDRNRSPYGGLSAALYYCLSLDELTVAVLVVYGALIGAFLLYRRRRSESLAWTAAVLGVLLLVLGGWLSARIWTDRLVREAVVTAITAEVRNGPSDDESVGFTLHEGSIVRLVQEEEGWLEVVHGGSARGWTRRENVERL